MKKVLSNIAVILVACILFSIAQIGSDTETIKWKLFLALTVVYLIYEGIKYLAMKNKPKEAKEEIQLQAAVTEVEENRNQLLKWVIKNKLHFVALFAAISLFIRYGYPFCKKIICDLFLA